MATPVITKEQMDKLFPNEAKGQASISDLQQLVLKLVEQGYITVPAVTP